jgi:hypothetical protein
MAMNFFGDFDPSPGAAFCGWGWTANRIEKCGYYHRDALFLTDDFKLGAGHRGGEVRVLQAYADGGGRGRLRADASTATTYPIRGLLLGTGEDLPQNHSSTLGRLVVLDTTPAPGDLRRGAECKKRRGWYRGVMADFIGWELSTGRLDGFADRVAGLQEVYYDGVERSTNGLRVAGNLAVLGAAFGELAAYLGVHGAWDGWKAEAARFVEVDLPAVRGAVLEDVRDQQPSVVFVHELRQLIAAGEVRLRDRPRPYLFDKGDDRHGAAKPIGRVRDGVVEVIPEAALAAVQGSLRRQGRAELAVSATTLKAQLVGDGLLLGRDGRVIKPTDRGRREYEQRIYEDGGKAYVIALSASALLGDGRD